MADAARITCFGGQGHRSLFSSRRKTAALEDARSSPAAALLLSRCHAAFLNELMSAQIEALSVVEELHGLFHTPEDLLSPVGSQDNPIIQGSTLCLQQLLEYLAHILPTDSTLDTVLPYHTDGAVGFCSGVLPATVVCSAQTVKKYIEYSTQAIRLAFWIGYRVAEFCEVQWGKCWREKGPWAMVISEIDNYDDLEKSIALYNIEYCSSPALQLSISSINTASCVSIAGAGPALEEFRISTSLKACSVQLVPIYGLYHAGQLALPILQTLLQDCRRCIIAFPNFAALRKPLRSSITGSLITALNRDEDTELIEVVLRSILIEPVNWKLTWEIIKQANADRNLDIEIQIVGPFSRALLPLPRTTDFPSKTEKIKILKLCGRDPRKNEATELPANSDCVAIVGMSVNYPIGTSKDAFWKALRDGLNAVQEIPMSRFEVSDYSEKSGSKSKVPRYGNFLEKPWAFDHEHFNVSPREVKSMDPQQRLLLQAAVHALNDAGYTPNSTPSFQRNSMGCYIGVATGDYAVNLRNEIDVYYSTGTLRAFLSGKISYAFKFSGPSVVVDTACSSSMVAIHQACRALKNRDCCSAIAGGVNSITSPDMHLGLARAHFLSATGQCKTFDAAADGYCRAEGCGLFVLKRLEDAISENDRIYGVIRGIEMNQCGNAHSITHPHQETQQALFHQLLSKTGIEPSTINVAEAHGTGTQAGDAAEAASLQAVFGRNHDTSSPLFITSVKSNTGHAEAASGAAGLAKLLLMLREKQIPPQVGLQNLNPRLASMGQHGISIATELQSWRAEGGVPRRALLNNFGAAGSNVALILEEHSSETEANGTGRSAYLFIASAHTGFGIERLRKYYIDWLCKHPDLNIRDICYTATARRQRYEFRISIVCKTLEDLCAKLDHLDKPIKAGPTMSSQTGPVIFVFSGQGSLYSGMGKELLGTSPIFRSAVLECDRYIKEIGFPTVLPMIDGALEVNEDLAFEQVVVSQSACFVLQYALTQLWSSWKIVPDIVIGHSLGEYAAMVQAEVMSLRDALHVILNRAALMTQYCAPRTTAMLACSAHSSDVQTAIKSNNGLYSKLCVACDNSLVDCVVSGPIQQIEAFKIQCKSRNWKCKQLDLPYGFHSAAMDPIMESVMQICSSVTLAPPNIPIGSNCYGRLLKPEDLSPHYLAKQMRSTVRFSEMIKSIPLEAINSATFLEIGPASTTLPMIRNTLPNQDFKYLSSLNPKRSPWTTLSGSLAQIDRSQEGIDWRQFFEGSGARLIDAPEYPLERSEFFIPFKETMETAVSKISVQTDSSACPLGLKESISASTQAIKVYETDVAALSYYIKGHVVAGVGLCPASVYHEIVLEAGQLAAQSSSETTMVVQVMTFDKPLVYDSAHESDRVRLLLETDQPLSGSEFVPDSFKVVSSKPNAVSEETVHCYGTIAIESTSSLKNSLARKAAMIKRQRSHLDRLQGSACDTFNTRMLYETIFSRVVQYSRNYQAITHLTVLENGSEGFGFFKIPPDDTPDGCTLSPVFVDTLLHGAGFIANSHINAMEVCICVRVESVIALSKSIDPRQTFSIYCSLLDCIEGTLLADAYALTEEGTVVAAVEGMHFKKLQLKAFQSHLLRQVSQSKTTSKPMKIEMPGQFRPEIPKELCLDKSRQAQQNCTTILETIDVKSTVLELVAEVCEISPQALSPTSILVSLGMDSLTLIEFSDLIEKRFPQLKIDRSTIISSSTVQNLQDYVQSINQVEVSTEPNTGTRHPLSGRRMFSRRPSTIHKEPVTPDLGNVNGKFHQDYDDYAPSSYFPSSVPLGKVKAVIKDLCDTPDSNFQPESTLESLGVDSLLSIELRDALIQKLGANVPADALAGHMTVESLGNLAAADSYEQPKSNSHSQTNDSANKWINGNTAAVVPRTQPVTVQSYPGSGVPLYLFHDGSGTVGMYSKLKSLDRQVYAFPNSGLGNEEHWASSMIEMAAHYASVIASTSDHSVILGGWSFGGVLAYEVARQLLQLHWDVKGVILIDSPCPKNHQPLPEPIIQHILRPLFKTNSTAQENSIAAVAAQFHAHAGFLSDYLPSPTFPPKDLRYVMLRNEETMDTSHLCGVAYPWLDDQEARSRSIKDWEDIVGCQITVLGIPGNHFEPFASQHVDAVSEKVREACDIICAT